jgi:phage FluMu protein Com
MGRHYNCSECRKLLFEGEVVKAKIRIVCPRCGAVNFFAVGNFFVDKPRVADKLKGVTSLKT